MMRIFRDLEMVEYLGSCIPRFLRAYSPDGFVFTDNFIRMVFPSTEEVTSQVTQQVGRLLNACYAGKFNRSELMKKVGIRAF